MGKQLKADEQGSRWIVSRQEFASLLGVHPDTVTEFARQGMPATAGGRGKLYDLRVCLAWWRERQGRAAEVTARTRAFNATAELNELKLQREHSQLVSRDIVIREGQSYTKAWANSVRSIARRARQAGIITSAEQQAQLDDLCRQLLVDISSWKTLADTERAARRKE